MSSVQAEQKEEQKEPRAKKRTITDLKRRSQSHKDRATEWKSKCDSLSDQMAEMSADRDSNTECAVAEALSREIAQWSETVNNLKEAHAKSISLLMPQTIEKIWVKNIDKKGKKLPWLNPIINYSESHLHTCFINRRIHGVEAKCR